VRILGNFELSVQDIKQDPFSQRRYILRSDIVFGSLRYLRNICLLHSLQAQRGAKSQKLTILLFLARLNIKGS
jgi:predicted secreted protein